METGSDLPVSERSADSSIAQHVKKSRTRAHPSSVSRRSRRSVPNATSYGSPNSEGENEVSPPQPQSTIPASKISRIVKEVLKTLCNEDVTDPEMSQVPEEHLPGTLFSMVHTLLIVFLSDPVYSIIITPSLSTSQMLHDVVSGIDW